jgi:hypothetical protein
MIVTVHPGAATTVLTPQTITVDMSLEEAQKLRRICYYNLTVGACFTNNPNGGVERGEAVKTFMGILGGSLKTAGVNRF